MSMFSQDQFWAFELSIGKKAMKTHGLHSLLWDCVCVCRKVSLRCVCLSWTASSLSLNLYSPTKPAWRRSRRASVCVHTSPTAPLFCRKYVLIAHSDLKYGPLFSFSSVQFRNNHITTAWLESCVRTKCGNKDPRQRLLSICKTTNIWCTYLKKQISIHVFKTFNIWQHVFKTYCKSKTHLCNIQIVAPWDLKVCNPKPPLQSLGAFIKMKCSRLVIFICAITSLTYDHRYLHIILIRSEACWGLRKDW